MAELPVQPKEGLELLKTKLGGQYVDQLMITSIQLGEENITKNYNTNWEVHQLSALKEGKGSKPKVRTRDAEKRG